MKWSRELKIAKRGMETALRVISANLSTPLQAPALPHKPLESRDFRDLAAPFSTTARVNGPEEIVEFGSNPGRLRMLIQVPPGCPRAKAPLVVVLHGCGQGAVEFADGSGWTALANELGFVLVMPEQSGRNNQGRCFQWFQPAHTTRGAGEVLSIRQMIGTAVRRFGADPKQVFVVGLSAGGAMAAALLAAYPDVFAGGAVVAGLPVGAASGPGQALIRMAHPGPQHSAAEWAELVVRVAGAAGQRRSWPRISIWHGMADTVVDPGNADLLTTQWGAVHNLPDTPTTDVNETAGRHRTWSKDGRAFLERWEIPDMAHGYPIDATMGRPGPYVIDTNISATRRIAQFWGLLH